MAGKRKIRLGICFYSMLAVFILLLAVLAALLLLAWRETAADRGKIETESRVFTESARELKNPNRGFYRMYSFPVTDKKADYRKLMSRIKKNDSDTKLMMAQINLKYYRDGRISKKGLANIRELLDVLETTDKQLIVRFVYDNEGKNEQSEPESLDVILGHMEQLEEILKEHGRKIFILQSLFIGNWGEMNGTRYDSDGELRELAQKLAQSTAPSTYLSVRIPAQWRRIMQSEYPSQYAAFGALAADRLGLFNDGMLGNEGDYGTYCTDEDKDGGEVHFPRRSRREEIRFQNELCRMAPNGGEVINDNRYNDFECAVKDLRNMRITYLNKAYDSKVLDKWKRAVVTEKGCFYRMDGLNYIERHLGYRLSIKKVSLEEDRKKNSLLAGIEIQNTGFAPLYKEPKTRIILQNEDNKEVLVYSVSWPLHTLAGGNEAEKTEILNVGIPLDELTGKRYTIYFSMEDMDTGEHILLANEEDEEQYGYRIGQVRIR